MPFLPFYLNFNLFFKEGGLFPWRSADFDWLGVMNVENNWLQSDRLSMNTWP